MSLLWWPIAALVFVAALFLRALVAAPLLWLLSVDAVLACPTAREQKGALHNSGILNPLPVASGSSQSPPLSSVVSPVPSAPIGSVSRSEPGQGAHATGNTNTNMDIRRSCSKSAPRCLRLLDAASLFLPLHCSAIGPLWPFPLADHSFFAQQLRRRLEAACRVPAALRASQRASSGWRHPRVGAKHLLRVRCQVGAFLMDMALGFLVLTWMGGTPGGAAAVGQGLHVGASLVGGRPVTETLRWLMGVPGGLKLNHRAGRWVGLLAIRCLASWGWCLQTTIGSGEWLAWALASVSGLGGLTLGVAALADLLRVAAIPVLLMQRGGAAAVNGLEWLLYSLGLVLRGTKRNVLRQRVDSVHLGTPQLLVAALAFTAAALFLLTPFVYHVFFTGVAFCLRLMVVLAGVTSALVDASPLLSLWMSLARPAVFQAGAWVEQVGQSAGDGDGDDAGVGAGAGAGAGAEGRKGRVGPEIDRSGPDAKE